MNINKKDSRIDGYKIAMKKSIKEILILINEDENKRLR
mgnify:FL=1